MPQDALEFDAALLARGWLSVALASGSDKDLPLLNRTVAIEQYPDGVRLVATDRYVVLHCWIPGAATDLAEEPALELAPERTVVAADPHGRAKGFLAYLLARAAADEEEEKQTLVTLDPYVIEPDDGPQGAFDDMDLEWVVLNYPGHERLRLSTVQGQWPDWRPMDARFTPKTTKAMALGPEIVGRLAKLGKYHTGPLVWHFGGAEKAARVHIGETLRVHGLVMPVHMGLEAEES